MPLKAGYSRETVAENIRELMRVGVGKSSAIAQAFSAGRVSFFKRYHHGALPLWLAFPRKNRTAGHYSRDGVPLAPTRVDKMHLQASRPDFESNESLYRNRPSRRLQNNPAPALQNKAALIRQAARRIARFTGMNDVSARKIRVSRQSDVVLDIGRVDGILYTTIRDGATEKYIHRFARNARPLLAASPDGKRLYLLGGAYTFTDRGIVDRKRSRPRSR